MSDLKKPSCIYIYECDKFFEDVFEFTNKNKMGQWEKNKEITLWYFYFYWYNKKNNYKFSSDELKTTISI